LDCVNGDTVRYVLLQRGTPIPALPEINHPHPWWDQALINPHIELLDYVKAIHPELAPEHQLTLLRRIE